MASHPGGRDTFFDTYSQSAGKESFSFRDNRTAITSHVVTFVMRRPTCSCGQLGIWFSVQIVKRKSNMVRIAFAEIQNSNHVSASWVKSIPDSRSHSRSSMRPMTHRLHLCPLVMQIRLKPISCLSTKALETCTTGFDVGKNLPSQCIANPVVLAVNAGHSQMLKLHRQEVTVPSRAVI